MRTDWTTHRIGLAALAVGLLGAAPARAQVFRPEGPAQQVGEVVGGALDNAGRAVERGLRNAFARTRGAVESMELAPRVYSRLLWDRELAGSRFALDTLPGGVVVLRGTVPTREKAERAVALAASTVGVSRVVSELVAPESTVVVPRTPEVVVGEDIKVEVEGASPLPEPTPLPEPEPEPGLDPEPLPRPAPAPAPSPTPLPEPGPVPAVRPPLP